jgi:hypothetical protein
MTREEAAAECARLAREAPDRERAAWFPRQEKSGEWTVVKVARPGTGLKRDELRTGLADDVRPDPAQDVPQEPGPYWGF